MGVNFGLEGADTLSSTDEEDAVACFVELRFEALTHCQAPEYRAPCFVELRFGRH